MRPERPLLFRSTLQGRIIWEIVDVYADNIGTVRFDYRDASGADPSINTRVPVDYLLEDIEHHQVEWV